MENKFGSAKEIGLYPREESEKNKWDKYNDLVMNESQYSFGDDALQKNFMIILCYSEEKKKYLFYRSEWYRRAKQFDYGKAPPAVTS